MFATSHMGKFARLHFCHSCQVMEKSGEWNSHGVLEIWLQSFPRNFNPVNSNKLKQILAFHWRWTENKLAINRQICISSEILKKLEKVERAENCKHLLGFFGPEASLHLKLFIVLELILRHSKILYFFFPR